MAGITQIDWTSLANEANARALLEDLMSYYKGLYQGQQLALAVWFGKSPQQPEHSVLALFTGPPVGRIVGPERQSLLWKTGLNQPPFANISWTSVDDFAGLLASTPESLDRYRKDFEVIYFDSPIPLPKNVLKFFGVVTEPPGLIKVWFLREDEYSKGQTVRGLLAARANVRPDTGLVKTWESDDFENCRALVNVLLGQRWQPSSPEGIKIYGFYGEWAQGRQPYFLAEGGALYRIIKFEVIRAPLYSDLVLEKLPDDRYPEVYLRAVHPPE